MLSDCILMYLNNSCQFVMYCRLYSDDPCLMYRINGLPAQRSENETVEYGGLNTRRHVVSTRHSDHGRRAVVTGDILTRTGSSRAGTFLDDYDRTKKDQNENNSNKYYAHEVPYNSYDCNKNYDNNMTYQYGINSIRSGSS